MILPFSTQLNGKPTYFIEKIWEGLLRTVKDDVQYIAYLNAHEKQCGKHWDYLPDEHERMTNPKLHTIREDKNDRWKPRTKIDFFINCRQKNMFRFAPILPVVSVQKVEIFYKGLFSAVAIDNVLFYTDADFKLGKSTAGMLQLAQNDGFDTIEDFFAYFNEDFKGKIIHWTDLRY
ncbi:hypothetical protein [Flavobacterium algoritolerans]|uniref:Uncharacterized protein n=1 Tax=Flavobacterium algoritolerans TaxID=3041254 RepID=A0ABT6V851_9FLAO|nr:hypothetical protein [Flavobacterium algoritolerans]MDI5894381.1 hypothetical protein [Flavobacterium algoritolerans]